MEDIIPFTMIYVTFIIFLAHMSVRAEKFWIDKKHLEQSGIQYKIIIILFLKWYKKHLYKIKYNSVLL